MTKKIPLPTGDIPEGAKVRFTKGSGMAELLCKKYKGRFKKHVHLYCMGYNFVSFPGMYLLKVVGFEKYHFAYPDELALVKGRRK